MAIVRSPETPQSANAASVSLRLGHGAARQWHEVPKGSPE